MLEKLFKKNEKGFTLAELLVVVAIIAILVAVSIPIFTSQLEKSREATDAANFRAAKAAATVAYLDSDAAVAQQYYDAEAGKLVSTKPAGYGKGTASGAVSADNAGKIIQIAVDANGAITEAWVD